MTNEIKGVAFDLDGTLYPNYRLNIRLFPLILKNIRLVSAFGKARGIIRIEQETKLPPDFYDYQVRITAGILNEPPDLVKEKIDQCIYKDWMPLFKKVKLFKNTVETLTVIKEAGYKLGLMSDFPCEEKLEYLGLTSIWDAVLCSEHCGALKPHPLPFKELAAAMALSPEQILYVGNKHSYDVIGANRAGMKTAWIKSPLFPGKGSKKPLPGFAFSNYRQLRKFMLN
jgi:putative hydrolase of the HAD superfamily